MRAACFYAFYVEENNLSYHLSQLPLENTVTDKVAMALYRIIMKTVIL